MTPEEFRKEALQIAGAIERSHGNHPDFRIGGKVFASIGAPDDEWAMVKLTPEEQTASIRTAPDVFIPCSGAWGRKGYTNVRLGLATVALARPALEMAARNVASSKRAKGR